MENLAELKKRLKSFDNFQRWMLDKKEKEEKDYLLKRIKELES